MCIPDTNQNQITSLAAVVDGLFVIHGVVGDWILDSRRAELGNNSHIHGHSTVAVGFEYDHLRADLGFELGLVETLRVSLAGANETAAIHGRRFKH